MQAPRSSRHGCIRPVIRANLLVLAGTVTILAAGRPDYGVSCKVILWWYYRYCADANCRHLNSHFRQYCFRNLSPRSWVQCCQRDHHAVDCQVVVFVRVARSTTLVQAARFRTCGTFGMRDSWMLIRHIVHSTTAPFNCSGNAGNGSAIIKPRRHPVFWV